MTQFLRALLVSGFVFALIGSAPARADLRACNRTTDTISVAIGYQENDIWTSEGWWTMVAGDCKVMVPGDLKNRHYYWRATRDGVPLPVENYYFCTSPKVFTILGDTQCEERGYDRVGFTGVDTGDAKDFTIDVFAEASDDLGDIRALLQGTWGSPKDPKLLIEIEGSTFTFIFDGDRKDPSKLEVAMTCPKSEGDGPVMLLTHSFTKGDPDCWLLVNTSPQSLEIYVYDTGEEAVLQRRK